MDRLFARFVLPAAAGLLLAAGPARALDVTGAGATFPAPLYAKWADEYRKATGVRINYQSVGSGAGLRQIRGRTVDFGASDMPLKDEQLEQDGLLQFPTAIGGIVPAYNLPGLGGHRLRFTGAVLADIYLRRITRWNDPQLVALNPGVPLPDKPIAVVRRADGSGTTFVWTNYLSKVSPEWKQRVGEGTAVKWPTGLGGKGNEGVAMYLQRLPHAIGYVEYSFARATRLTYGLVRNAAGQFPLADDRSFQAAAAAADWDRSFHQILTDRPGADAWPITAATFVLLHRRQERPQQAAAALQFFDWAYGQGAKMALDLDYVPMPAPVIAVVRRHWDRVQDAAGVPVRKRAG